MELVTCRLITYFEPGFGERQYLKITSSELCADGAIIMLKTTGIEMKKVNTLGATNTIKT